MRRSGYLRATDNTDNTIKRRSGYIKAKGYVKMDGKEDDISPNRKSKRNKAPVDKYQPGMEDNRGTSKKKKGKEKGNKETSNQKQAAVEPTEEDKSYVKMPYSQRPTQALMAVGLKISHSTCLIGKQKENIVPGNC